MKRVLVFCGSRRTGSHNRRFAEFLATQISAWVQVDLVSGEIVDLPLFDEDLEDDPTIITRLEPLYHRFLAADAFIFTTPEYNASLTPYFKNTIDWVSRLPHIAPQRYTNPLQGKPVLLTCATTGRSNGILGLLAARQVLTHLGCLVLAEQVGVSCADRVWDDKGSLRDLDLLGRTCFALDRLMYLMALHESEHVVHG